MAKFSRLIRKQESKNVKLAVIYGILTLALAVAVIAFGIPALIKLAIFLGDIRSSSVPIESQDTIPPSPPIFTTSAEATSKRFLSVAGYAEPAAKVTIVVNTLEGGEVVADNEGLFKFEINLDEGENEIYALAKDGAGNESGQSQKLMIVFDEKPPKLEVTAPSKEKTTTDKNKIEIVGLTEAGATVTINEHLTVLDQNGAFTYSLGLSAGENEIMVTATDKAGNKTEKILTVTFSE